MDFLPITSSIIAALDNTTPILVAVRPLACMTVNVVPKLVEHREAPATRACNGVAPVKTIKMNDIPIGKQTPVYATNKDKRRLAFKLLGDVVRPPMR